VKKSSDSEENTFYFINNRYKKYFAFKAQGETSCILSSSGGKQERKGFFLD
jgi:hypothetical protein